MWRKSKFLELSISGRQHAGASHLLPHHHYDGKDNMDRASQVPPLRKRAHIENMYELRQVDYGCGYRTTGEIVHCPGIREGAGPHGHIAVLKWELTVDRHAACRIT
jgi:hypothetical protein